MLEWETHSIFLVGILCPDISGQVFTNERFSACGENGETRKIIWLFEMRSGLNIFCRSLRTSKLLFSSNHSSNTIVHVLHKSNFRSSESTSVRDIINVVVGLGVFSMGSTDLDVVLVCNCLEFVLLLTEVGQVNVDRSSEGCSKISWARGNVAEAFIMSELGDLLDVCGGYGESGENGTNISSRLHRDDSELIFLIYPDQESLVVVVEDSTTFRPVSVQTAGLKESVSLLEKEVIIDQLFTISV